MSIQQVTLTQQVSGARGFPTTMSSTTHTRAQVGENRCDVNYGQYMRINSFVNTNNSNFRDSFVRPSDPTNFFVNTNNSNSRDCFVRPSDPTDYFVNTNNTRDYFVRPDIPRLPTGILNEIDNVVNKHSPIIANAPNVLAAVKGGGECLE